MRSALFAIAVQTGVLGFWIVGRELVTARLAAAVTLMLCLAVGSWLVNASTRLTAFVLAGLIAPFLILPPLSAALFLVLALSLIAFAMSSLSFAVKAMALSTVSAVLLYLAFSFEPNSMLAGVVPVLGALFMFRLANFIKETSGQPELKNWKKALAYFFIPTNLVAALFPIIDFRTFSQNYASSHNLESYRRGLALITAGAIHLLLYRFVKFFIHIPIEVVSSVEELVIFLFGNYLLYLQVSGSFHLFVGLLHLFGFQLPETHRLYFFASSFTDYWRRINIYWKDFMVRLFFNPLYFRLRKKGHRMALTVATLAVFVLTWALHSYQYLWIRGEFPIKAVDMIFWGALGVLVTVNALIEDKFPKKRNEANSLKRFLVKALKITGTFTTLSVLWGIWYLDDLDRIPALFSRLQLKGASDLLWLLLFPAMGLAGATWERFTAKNLLQRVALPRISFQYGQALSLITAATFGIVMSDSLLKRFPAFEREIFRSLRQNRYATYSGTEKMDEAQGYYVGLQTFGTSISGGLADTFSVNPKRPCDRLECTSAFEPTSDLRRFKHRKNAVTEFNGHEFKINEWGTPDLNLKLEKAPNTLRGIVLGTSVSYPFGIPQGTEWPSVATRILNPQTSRGLASDSPKIELVNLSVTFYCYLRYPLVLELEAPQFSPDFVLIEGHPSLLGRTYDTLITTLRRALPLYPSMLEPLGLHSPFSLQARLYRQSEDFDEAIKVATLALTELKHRLEARHLPSRVLALPSVMNSDSQPFVLLAAEKAGFEIWDFQKIGSDLSEKDRAGFANHPSVLVHEKLGRAIAERLRNEFGNLRYKGASHE